MPTTVSVHQVSLLVYGKGEEYSIIFANYDLKDTFSSFKNIGYQDTIKSFSYRRNPYKYPTTF